MPAFAPVFPMRHNGSARLFSLGKMLCGRRKSAGEPLVSRRDAEMAGSKWPRRRRHWNGADRQWRFPEGVGVPARRAERRANHRILPVRKANSISEDASRLVHLAHSNPRPIQAYRRDSVQINGATKLDDIIWRGSPTRIIYQPRRHWSLKLSSAEILLELAGHAEEEAMLQKNCSGCHSLAADFQESL